MQEEEDQLSKLEPWLLVRLPFHIGSAATAAIVHVAWSNWLRQAELLGASLSKSLPPIMKGIALPQLWVVCSIHKSSLAAKKAFGLDVFKGLDKCMYAY